MRVKGTEGETVGVRTRWGMRKEWCAAVVVCLFAAFSTPAAESKPTIAVLDLKAMNIDSAEGVILSEKLRSELTLTDSFTVVERGVMNDILREQGFQQTGCTSSECAVQAGQLLNAHKMVAGTVGKLENAFVVTLRLIDVESGVVDKTVEEIMTGGLVDLLRGGIRNAACRMAGILEASTGVDGGSSGRGTTQTGTIDLTVEPYDAEIFLNGQSYGVGNRLVELTPGTYRLEVRRSNFPSFERELEVVRGEVLSVRANLRAMLRKRRVRYIAAGSFVTLFRDAEGLNGIEGFTGYGYGAELGLMLRQKQRITLTFRVMPFMNPADISESQLLGGGYTGSVEGDSRQRLIEYSVGGGLRWGWNVLPGDGPFTLIPGVLLGFWHEEYGYWIDGYDTKCSFTSNYFGGASLSVGVGGKLVRAVLAYELRLGANERQYPLDIYGTRHNSSGFSTIQDISVGVELSL